MFDISARLLVGPKTLKPRTPSRKQQNGLVAAGPVKGKSVCFLARAFGYDEELLETAICCFRCFVAARNNNNSIGFIVMGFVVFENPFSFALIV
jgi:hypothetical protein